MRGKNCPAQYKKKKKMLAELVRASVDTIHRFIDASMYRDTFHAIRIMIQFAKNRDASDLATFLHFLFECRTNINHPLIQSSKRQCLGSRHVGPPKAIFWGTDLSAPQRQLAGEPTGLLPNAR